jgi:hypothetical protein
MKTLQKKMTLDALKSNAEVVLSKDQLVGVRGGDDCYSRSCYYTTICTDTYMGYYDGCYACVDGCTYMDDQPAVNAAGCYRAWGNGENGGPFGDGTCQTGPFP